MWEKRLRIQVSKQPDGSGSMRCTRADGSETWQKQTKHAAHFALHDLTHLAVETALGYQRGFFGLLSVGWDFGDTGGKGVRGPLPPEAVEVERIVGVFDSERACGMLWTLEEFNEYAPRLFTQDEIFAVRSLRGDLFRQWAEVPPGQKLELQFPMSSFKRSALCAAKPESSLSK
jgi:hypothetical protein